MTIDLDSGPSPFAAFRECASTPLNPEKAFRVLHDKRDINPMLEDESAVQFTNPPARSPAWMTVMFDRSRFASYPLEISPLLSGDAL
jgi:hypothetical protein